jgi:hypothetical protein
VQRLDPLIHCDRSRSWNVTGALDVAKKAFSVWDGYLSASALLLNQLILES